MTMDVTFDIRTIPLASKWFRYQAAAFLERQGLALDAGLDMLLGVYGQDDTLIGCGGLEGNIIKCVALSEQTRGHNIAPALVSELYAAARRRGAENVLVFTKPECREVFASMGFHAVASAPRAVMMQSAPAALERYLRSLRSLPRGKRNGVIVVNANPMTIGHLYLIREAARQVDCLTVIPVADNPSTEFPYETRHAILRRECASIPGVTVAEGSQYAVSAATFPSYFIKERQAVTDTHIALDLDLFVSHIAPALDATVRFVGSEPADALTAAYNEGMHRLLPPRGIEVVEIPRLLIDGSPVSASALRRALSDGRLDRVAQTAAPATLAAILADKAARAMKQELDLTPKPGLVDRDNPGAHSDMDHSLMSASIGAIRPWFEEMALAAMALPGEEDRVRRISLLRRLGCEAEKAMLSATGGVNTHRGAIFSLGLAVSAAAVLLRRGSGLTVASLCNEIASSASLIAPPDNTHGAYVRREYGVKGALQMARTGYRRMLERWLPMRRQLQSRGDTACDLKLLLVIMLSIDDSNVLYRCGPDVARYAREMATELLERFDTKGMVRLDKEFSRKGISHGGSADMLALTILADTLLPPDSI